MQTERMEQEPPREVRARLVRAALRDLQTGLRQVYGEPVPSIVVYGSQARGQARADSDVDVLLVFANAMQPGAEIRRVSHILADLNIRYGVLISIVPATEEEYRNASTPFWMNIRQEGVNVDAI